MKLIGITGKTGAGKTTLSDILEKNEDVGVIHVDELFEKLKKEKLSRIMERNSKGKPVAIKKSFKRILYGNKYVFLMFVRIKGILLSEKIDEKIQEFQNMEKNIVVIESVHLRYFPIFKKLDKKVFIKRPYIERRESVLIRDKGKNMDKEVFVLLDIPYNRSFYKENMDNYEYKVNNDSMKKLEKVAERIYKDISQTNERKRRKDKLKKYVVNANEREKYNRQPEINTCKQKESEEKEIYEVR